MRATFTSSVRGFKRQTKAAAKEVERMSQEVIEQAVGELKQATLVEVPRDTGTLASSIYTDVKALKGRVEGTVGYGAGDPINPNNLALTSEYMVAVHENLSANHPVGKAKFLEDPARQMEGKLIEQIGEAIDLEIRAIFAGK